MRIVMFCHSLLSDWNHGNAHFLRGVASELVARGHEVRVYEPRDGWSLRTSWPSTATRRLASSRSAYPQLAQHALRPRDRSTSTRRSTAPTWCSCTSGTSPSWSRASARTARGPRRYRLLFHDTHHRVVTDPQAMAGYDLRALRRRARLRRGDPRPLPANGLGAARLDLARGRRHARLPPAEPAREREGDLVWIGNWGDEERTAELQRVPDRAGAATRALRARCHGVRYPRRRSRALAEAGIEYGGWLPNYRRARGLRALPRHGARPAPAVRARRCPGIPTIRVFEALACGIPLVCAPWDDARACSRRARISSWRTTARR